MSAASRPWTALRGDAAGLMLAVLACAHPWLEHTMARHMGLELPALLALGWMAAAHAGDALTRTLARWNANGLPGLLFALCVTGFWMVPAALDQAVLHDGMALAKVASLVAAGLLARASWSGAGMVLQAFFVLNWFWMTLAAGLLYQDAPRQVCSVYLIDQQGQAGVAMVIWTLVGMGLWLIHAARGSGLFDEPEDEPPRFEAEVA